MFAMNPMHESEASKLRKQLEAAKLREAEVQSQLTESQQREAVVCNKNLALMDQRDAATGALEIARTALSEIHRQFYTAGIAKDALSQLADPSAVLAERDRVQQLIGWQDCLGSVLGSLRGYPDCGGDIEIMKEVDRISFERVSKTRIVIRGL